MIAEAVTHVVFVAGALAYTARRGSRHTFLSERRHVRDLLRSLARRLGVA